MYDLRHQLQMEQLERNLFWDSGIHFRSMNAFQNHMASILNISDIYQRFLILNKTLVEYCESNSVGPKSVDKMTSNVSQKICLVITLYSSSFAHPVYRNNNSKSELFISLCLSKYRLSHHRSSVGLLTRLLDAIQG